MNPNNEEILLKYNSQFTVYKNGRIVRFAGTDVAPPGTDPITKVTTQDVTIDSHKNIQARIYLPTVTNCSSKNLPVLIYFHGGGFCYHSAFSPPFQPYLNSLASKARIIIVSVNYRLATEHLLPTAYNDSWDAIKWTFSSSSDEWLIQNGDLEHVFLGGDSAGANIAHQMALRAGGDDSIKIEGMILEHPFFWGSKPIGSETTDVEKRGFVQLLWTVVNSPSIDIDHPWINPISKDAPSLAGLGCKRVLVCVAENDILAERGRMYVNALKESGWVGEVELFESEGVDHVFFLKDFKNEKSMELVDKVIGFLSHE